VRSSAMTLPSLGRDRGATQATSPPSFVTLRSVALTTCRVRICGFRLQRHGVGLALAGDNETQPSEFGMAPGDFRDLLGPHEHALDLGGLVGAAHPALDAHIGAAAGAGAGQGGREVAKQGILCRFEPELLFCVIKPEPRDQPCETGSCSSCEVKMRLR
jgi:hypothetical protein